MFYKGNTIEHLNIYFPYLYKTDAYVCVLEVGGGGALTIH